ncbi:MAG: oligosaccharide flippase family protein [Blastocatellia bacterium]|nr:oligosaccharide flippase family protein [Blastocatellia bacterium]
MKTTDNRQPTTDNRLARARWTGIATLLARGMIFGITLLTLPLTSRHLGRERFGLWLTLTGLLLWTSVADLGLSNSLINALSTAEGSEDRARARRAVAAAFWLIAAVTGAGMAATLIAGRLVDWAALFQLQTPQAIAEAGPAATLVLLFCWMRVLTSLLSSIYQAHQEGYVHQLWGGLGGLLGAAGLAAAIRARAGLPGLLLGFMGGMLLAELLSAVWLFGWRRPWLRPRWETFEFAEARSLLRLGGQFWIAQISSVLLLQTDLVIVTRLFGAREAAAYGTTLRLFGLIGAAQAAFVAPLWAAYSEALARRDTAWLRRTFRASLRASLFWAVPAAGLFFLLMPFLFRLLVTPDVTSDPHLRAAVMTNEIVNAVARCIAMLLNGLGAVRSQALFGPLGGLANLALSVALGRWLGPPGVAWATTICLVVFWLGVMGKDARLRLREM